MVERKRINMFLNEKQEGKLKKDNCELCYYTFGLLKKAHNCKRCLRTVCADEKCSSRKIVKFLKNRKNKNQKPLDPRNNN
jgi:hypothetical protein